MNEIQPDWDHHTVPAEIHFTEEQTERMTLTSGMNRAENRMNIILSDLDGTLCDTYISTDPESGDRHHLLDPEILAEAKQIPIIVATQRRAKHTCLPELWRQGLVHSGLPIIAENGGVIVLRDKNDLQLFDQVAKPGSFEMARDWLEHAEHEALEIPHELELIKKPGDTMMIARLENELGISTLEDQQLLLEQLRSVDLPSGLTVVSSGDSLCIQDETVNKARGFHVALEWLGLKRSELFVIGLGNGLNDAAIFEEADIGIGVSPEVSHLVDIAMNRGPESTKLVLQHHSKNAFVQVRPEITDLTDDRLKIDQIDAARDIALKKRTILTRRVGKVKAITGMDPVDPVREAEQFAKCTAREKQLGLPPGILVADRRNVIDATVIEHKKLQEEKDE